MLPRSMWVHSPAPLLPLQPVLPAQLLPSHSQDNDAPAPGSCCEKSHVCEAALSSKSRSNSKFRVQTGESPCCPSSPCWGLRSQRIPMTAWDRFAVPTSTTTHPKGRILGGFTQQEPCATHGTGPWGLRHHTAHPNTGNQEMLDGQGSSGVLEKMPQLGALRGAGPLLGRGAARTGSPCSPSQPRLKNQLQSPVEQRQLCLPSLAPPQLPALPAPAAGRQHPGSSQLPLWLGVPGRRSGS